MTVILPAVYPAPTLYPPPKQLEGSADAGGLDFSIVLDPEELAPHPFLANPPDWLVVPPLLPPASRAVKISVPPLKPRRILRYTQSTPNLLSPPPLHSAAGETPTSRTRCPGEVATGTPAVLSLAKADVIVLETTR